MKSQPNIPSFQYTFSSEDLDFITSRFAAIVNEKRFLTMGQYGEEFEKSMAQTVGSNFAVATSSCTSALEIILRSLDVIGGEVLLPTNTFAATAFAVLRAGATPRFIDCDSNMQLSFAQLSQKINSKTKAVVVVHVGGFISADILRIKKLCAEKNIFLVEDAAHAIGSQRGGQRAGAFGDAAAFSFFSTKVITTGEGGMIVTSRRDILDKSRMYRNQGSESEHNIVVEGNNWRMTEVQALMGITQIRRLAEFIQKRSRIAKIYDEVFRHSDSIQRIQQDEDCQPNYYKYTLRLNSRSPSNLQVCEQLKKEYGIQMGGFTYLVPCHKQPVFKTWAEGDFPIAEDICVRHICPPIFPEMTEAQAHYVATSILKVVG